MPNTPVEALEYACPLRVRQYAIRRGSDGDGIIREIELLTDAQVTLLADRRRIPPYGLAGGKPGQVGAAELIAKGKTRRLRGKFLLAAKAGD